MTRSARPGATAVAFCCIAWAAAAAGAADGNGAYGTGTFTKTFPIHTEVELRVDQPISAAKTIEAVGDMTLAFSPGPSADLLAVRFERLVLRFGVFELPLPTGQKLRIDRLHVGPADLDREASVGTYNRRTKEVEIALVLTLDPRRQTDLAKLGITSPIRFSIRETGRIDLESGYLLTRTEPIPLQLGALVGTALGRQFSPCVGGLFPNPTETWEVVMACPDGEAFVEVCCGTESGQACSEIGAFDVANEIGPAACIAVSVLNFTPCSLSRCPVI